MSNPAPRPALRKAPDSHINPAYPTGSRALLTPATADQDAAIDLRSRPVLTTPSVVAAPTPDFATRTPDLVVEVVPPKSAKQKKAKKSKKSNVKGSDKADKQQGSSKKSTKKDKKKLKKIHNKLALTAKARRKLREGAKARGTSVEGTVDAVVSDLLSGSK